MTTIKDHIVREEKNEAEIQANLSTATAKNTRIFPILSR